MRLKDKKDVYFLTTVHKPQEVNTHKQNRNGDVVMKQDLVHSYNQYMGGVDKNDAVLSNYSAVRKSHKWTTKIFFSFR